MNHIMLATVLSGIAFLALVAFLFGRWVGREEMRDKYAAKQLAANRSAMLDMADLTARVRPTIPPLDLAGLVGRSGFKYRPQAIDRHNLSCRTCSSFKTCLRTDKPFPAPSCHSALFVQGSAKPV